MTKDEEIARLRRQVATLEDKVSQLRSSNAALTVDGDRREQRALALLPDCDAHRRELQYLRHRVSWYWSEMTSAEEAGTSSGRSPRDRAAAAPDRDLHRHRRGRELKGHRQAQGPLKRERHPTLADCIRAGGCDHDGLSDAVLADIAEALGLAVTADA